MKTDTKQWLVVGVVEGKCSVVLSKILFQKKTTFQYSSAHARS
jgi:hypothetical protein